MVKFAVSNVKMVTDSILIAALALAVTMKLTLLDAQAATLTVMET